LTHYSSNLYSQHFALIADHFRNTEKAFNVIEQLRGRITTDLLTWFVRRNRG